MSTAIDISSQLVNFDQATAALQADSRTVVVYSKPSCVQCTATYRALLKKSVDFIVVDVTESEAALARLLDWGYQQVPAVETADDHWHGYRPDKITALAALVNA